MATRHIGAVNFIWFRLGDWQIRVNDIAVNSNPLLGWRRFVIIASLLTMVPAGTTEYKDEVHVVFKCSLYAAVKTMHNWFGGEGRVRGGGGCVPYVYDVYDT